MRRRRQKTRTETVYRSSYDKVFAGVCGGLAKHFGVNPFWFRFGFVVGTILGSGLPVIFYVVCLFLMPRDSDMVPPLPTDAMASGPRFGSQREALDELHRQFDIIETKVRGMEDYVTSKEYVLKRKFENL